ncbi:MAG: hypothetical protein NTV51_03800 [Verrucomicrobia bacterium]|nr:hypothetical protein [Verrucomicrobiota bacterium]
MDLLSAHAAGKGCLSRRGSGVEQRLGGQHIAGAVDRTAVFENLVEGVLRERTESDADAEVEPEQRAMGEHAGDAGGEGERVVGIGVGRGGGRGGRGLGGRGAVEGVGEREGERGALEGAVDVELQEVRAGLVAQRENGRDAALGVGAREVGVEAADGERVGGEGGGRRGGSRSRRWRGLRGETGPSRGAPPSMDCPSASTGAELKNLERPYERSMP